MKMWRTAKPVLAGLALATIVAACGSGDSGSTTPAPAAPSAPAAPAAPAEPEPFDIETYFEGKTIRFMTSSRPGGGADLAVRALASSITRFIPGNPAVQVSNITPHVAGMNFLWNAPADGLTVGLFAAPTLEFEYFEGATWDSGQFQYIGTVDNQCQNMMLMRGNLGYSSIEDLKGKASTGGRPLITMAAAATPADFEPVEISTMLIADYLDIPLEIRRVADSGTSALLLALERNEINLARMGNSWCTIPRSNPGWLENGFVIPFLDVAVSGPAEYMPPVVEELGIRPKHVSEVLTEAQYGEWRGIVAASRAGGRPVVLPPNTPQPVVDAWRAIWDEAFADEDFFTAITRGWGGSDLIIYNGVEAQTLFEENKALMDASRATSEELVARLFAKYVK